MSHIRNSKKSKRNGLIEVYENARQVWQAFIWGYFVRLVLGRSRKYIKNFRKIINIDSRIKEALLRSIKRYEIRFAKSDYLEGLFETPIRFIYILLSIIFLFIMPFCVKLVFNFSFR